MAEYDTVTVGANEALTVEIGGGEIIENKIYDVTADGAAVLFRATGDGWKIHNIGVRGTNSITSGYMMYVGTDGGTGVVENFYHGDGFEHIEPKPVTIRRDNTGEVNIRQMYLAGSERGISSYTNDGGSLVVEDSYVRRMNIAGLKITGGDEVLNTVVDQTEQVQPTEGGARNARGIWALDGGTAIVEGCDIDVSGPNGSTAFDTDANTNVAATNCRYSGDFANRPDRVITSNVTEGANLTIPMGCPTSPEEAATAERDEPLPDPEPPSDGDDGTDGGDDGTNGGDDGTNGGDDGGTQPDRSGIPVEYVAAGGAAVALGYYLTRGE